MFRFGCYGLSLLLLLIWSPFAGSNSGYSNRDLLMLCIETVNDESWRNYLEPSCEHYIKGWLDAMDYYSTTKSTLCLPNQSFNSREIAQHFVRWAVFHPEEYEQPANDGIASVIKELYSCN